MPIPGFVGTNIAKIWMDESDDFSINGSAVFSSSGTTEQTTVKTDRRAIGTKCGSPVKVVV